MTTNILSYLRRQKIDKLQVQLDTTHEFYLAFSGNLGPHLKRRIKKALTKIQQQIEQLQNEN